jgi:hypothetical protein
LGIVVDAGEGQDSGRPVIAFYLVDKLLPTADMDKITSLNGPAPAAV